MLMITNPAIGRDCAPVAAVGVGRSMGGLSPHGSALQLLPATCVGIKRGDLVSFHAPGSALPLLKRVAGVEGDSVRVEQGRLLVNGRVETTSSGHPLVVPNTSPLRSVDAVTGGHVLVLSDITGGDDSLRNGLIPVEWVTHVAFRSEGPRVIAFIDAASIDASREGLQRAALFAYSRGFSVVALDRASVGDSDFVDLTEVFRDAE